MKIVIEFYRTRAQDDAHAVVAREVREASDLDEAICIARILSLTLDMPQFPDVMSIADARGGRLYSIQLGANDNSKKDAAMNGPEVESLTAIVLENEGGAPERDSMDYLYGRRVEQDGSWSIYHVFTGVPAVIQGRRMTGMSRSNATHCMLSLNRRDEGQRANAGCRVVVRPIAAIDGE
ncbi:hypothetical protein [Mesorhizobium silamurunense]|uniref:hypothetical protein n=1 Tax=Mesorhizobium silamurunense TaxID=499528 RepID=UPI0028B1ED8E|nr:hypothetical protein [Mesorhizobium silamurunense]